MTATAQPSTSSTACSTDRIEKKITINAPRSRVWRAISDSQEFGTWFRMRLDGPFVAGKPISGNITHPGYEHVKVDMVVDRIQPESYFSYKWHPYAIDTNSDYSREPMTLVEFHLSDIADGTQLTVVESGFDRLSPPRRVTAFRMNEQGWAKQLTHIENQLTT